MAQRALDQAASGGSGMATATGAPASRSPVTTAGLLDRGFRRQETRWAFVFLAPWIVGFVVFTGGPMLASLVLSLTRHDVISAPPLHRPGQLPAAPDRPGRR